MGLHQVIGAVGSLEQAEQAQFLGDQGQALWILRTDGLKMALETYGKHEEN